MDRAQQLQRELQAEADAYRALQQDIQGNHKARQQFTQQLSENAMVLQELALAGEDGKVYKLIGPALVRQDMVEARSNIQKRLDFISAELRRLDSQLKTHEAKQGQKQQQIIRIQKEMQTMQPVAAS